MNITPFLSTAITNVAPTLSLSVSQRATNLNSSNIDVVVNNVQAANPVALPRVNGVSPSAPANLPERSSTEGSITKTEPSTGVAKQSGTEAAPAAEVSSDGHDQKRADESPAVASRATVQAEQGADSTSGLSEEEFRQITELAARNLEVRAHEQAHKSVGGQFTGAVSYSYQTGPDGKRYAIGGEVPIDSSPVSGDPLATIAKMRTVIAAARAPADPSPQDTKVAAMAARQLTNAQVELSLQRLQQQKESGEATENTSQRVSAASTYQEITGLIETEKSSVDEFA